jgi:hypothetical protein
VFGPIFYPGRYPAGKNFFTHRPVRAEPIYPCFLEKAIVVYKEKQKIPFPVKKRINTTQK